jgi:hypothetical protein
MSTTISISGRDFYFEKLTDWPKERLEYIRAWKLAFGRDGYEERIDWLIGSPLNKTYVLRDKKGLIVAAYSLIRNRIMHSGSLVDSAICNNVFCIPDYQGLNLFVRIGRLSLADSASDYAFAYGFPNPAAIAGHKRVGWKLSHDAFNISIKLSNKDKFNSLNASYSPAVLSEALARGKQQEICKQMADIALTKAISAKKNLSVVKSEEYIYWRFFHRPKTEDRSYLVLTTKGAHVLFSVYKPRNEINILDFQALTDSSESAVLESLIYYAYAKDVHTIKLFGCSGNRLVLGMQEILGAKEDDVHYEGVNMIVTALGGEQIDFEQSKLQCSMSFLDNDVY